MATLDPPMSATGHTKFTPDVLTRVFAAVRTGHTVIDACTYAGIKTSTYDDWLAKGRRGEQPYALFFDIIERLNVASYHHAVECFSQGAAKDPKVAERFLARRARKEWGLGEDAGGGGQITVQIGGFVLEGGPE